MVSIPPVSPLGDGGDGPEREGSRRPRGTRALLRGGWAPSGRTAVRCPVEGTGPFDPSRSDPPPPASRALPHDSRHGCGAHKFAPGRRRGGL